jgi:hypothetical protein
MRTENHELHLSALFRGNFPSSIISPVNQRVHFSVKVHAIVDKVLSPASLVAGGDGIKTTPECGGQVRLA